LVAPAAGYAEEMARKIASWWLDVQGRFDEYMVALDDDVVDGHDLEIAGT
jgi:hypothetical protein